MQTFSRLKRWAKKGCLKFSKGKQRVLHLRRNDHTHQPRLGTDLLGSKSTEKDLEVLMDNKMSMSQQCLCGQQSQWCPGLH